ncbi:MAG: Aminopeptidase P [Candidatus Peregrinibacteria bacterium GW2011_GWA2_47_7]|nr:MAG: Aminopeptidase P [Candidatus Peregrinibacteria bacterium GW2011_GWA2_47_7]
MSNFSGSNGSLFVTQKAAYLLTDFRYILEARSIVPRGISVIDYGRKGFEKIWKDLLKKHRVKRIGYEADALTCRQYKKITSYQKSIFYTDLGDAVSALRMQKESVELAHITRAQNITDNIFSALKKKVRGGMSEKEIAWLIEELARAFGADDISFEPIVAFNEHSAEPHHHCTDRKLKKGNLILLDFGVRYKGYCSDMTRMLFSKKPTKKERRVYETVLHAQESARAQLRAGVHGDAIDTTARDIIDRAGFKGRFGHSLGHGVGLDVHELPNLSAYYKGIIPEKSVVTIEPGIYLDGEFGVRIEDMDVVEKNGTRVLTRSPTRIEDCTVIL